MARTVENDRRLDSTYFVAFDLMHTALKAGLKAASGLNITQYRMLVLLLGLSPETIGQSNLGGLLHLKPNVVTQALDVLEELGYVRRLRCAEDARSRTVEITDTGVAHVAKVNESLVQELYTHFPTENQTFRHILEASIAAGAAIDPSSSEKTMRQFPASRTLVSFELIGQAMAEGLREACGASFSECRVMQRLNEEGTPLRIGDIADRLHMNTVNVARAVDRLVQRGWVKRMGIPSDKKAVFAVVTEEGERQQRVIEKAIDDMAEQYLWSKLNKVQNHAIAQVSDIVFADIQAKKEAEHKAMLGLLQPL